MYILVEFLATSFIATLFIAICFIVVDGKGNHVNIATSQLDALCFIVAIG